MRVRPSSARDLPSLLALYRELRPQDPVLAPDEAAAAFDAIASNAAVHLLVCEHGEALVATCQLAIVPNLASGARPFALVKHVVTAAAHRRRGHAERVLLHALETAWAAGCCKVMLLCGVQRQDAHRLYESVGFVGGVEAGFVARPPR